MRESRIIVSKLCAAAWTDVVVRRRVRHRFIHTNRASVFHSISYIRPGALVVEKLGDGSRPSNDLVRWHDIVRSYNRTRDYRNSEMIVRDVRSGRSVPF